MAGAQLAKDIARYDREAPDWRERVAEASQRHGEEYFWLGDGSGFAVEANLDPYSRQPYVFVEHRCGWSVRLEGSHRYLSNLIADQVMPHRAHGCRDGV